MSSRVPLPTPSPAEGLHRVCARIPTHSPRGCLKSWTVRFGLGSATILTAASIASNGAHPSRWPHFYVRTRFITNAAEYWVARSTRAITISYGLSQPFLRLKSAAGSNKPYDQQENDGADRGIDDLRDEAGADVDAKLRKQIAGNQRAGNTDENIADEPKAGAAHDLSGQPARNQADE